MKKLKNLFAFVAGLALLVGCSESDVYPDVKIDNVTIGYDKIVITGNQMACPDTYCHYLAVNTRAIPVNKWVWHVPNDWKIINQENYGNESHLEVYTSCLLVEQWEIWVEARSDFGMTLSEIFIGYGVAN